MTKGQETDMEQERAATWVGPVCGGQEGGTRVAAGLLGPCRARDFSRPLELPAQEGRRCRAEWAGSRGAADGRRGWRTRARPGAESHHPREGPSGPWSGPQRATRGLWGLLEAPVKDRQNLPHLQTPRPDGVGDGVPPRREVFWEEARG